MSCPVAWSAPFLVMLRLLRVPEGIAMIMTSLQFYVYLDQFFFFFWGGGGRVSITVRFYPVVIRGPAKSPDCGFLLLA